MSREKATHPAEISAARLGKHYEKWFDRFSGDERDAISKVRHALYRIADEDEDEKDGTQ